MGDINKLAIEKVRKVILEMFRGYPHYVYWGLFEKAFRDKAEAEAVIRLLRNDGIIEVSNIDSKERAYRLTSKGIDFAVSMTQLEYSKRMGQLTVSIIILSIITLVLSFIQLITLFSI